MVVLRCTRALLARLKQPANLPPAESTTRLGDWYGKIARIDGRHYLLFISERSRLPILIPIRDGKRLREIFPAVACEALKDAGLAESPILPLGGADSPTLTRSLFAR